MPMTQPRTVRNLVHSARSSCVNPSRPAGCPGGRGDRGAVIGATSAGRLGAELDRVAGEFHVGLLQRGAVRGDLGERHGVLRQQRHDLLAASPETVSVSGR